MKLSELITQLQAIEAQEDCEVCLEVSYGGGEFGDYPCKAVAPLVMIEAQEDKLVLKDMDW